MYYVHFLSSLPHIINCRRFDLIYYFPVIKTPMLCCDKDWHSGKCNYSKKECKLISFKEVYILWNGVRKDCHPYISCALAYRNYDMTCYSSKHSSFNRLFSTYYKKVTMLDEYEVRKSWSNEKIKSSIKSLEEALPQNIFKQIKFYWIKVELNRGKLLIAGSVTKHYSPHKESLAIGSGLHAADGEQQGG